jgi:hypothetical protein
MKLSIWKKLKKRYYLNKQEMIYPNKGLVLQFKISILSLHKINSLRANVNIIYPGHLIYDPDIIPTAVVIP